MANTSRQCAVDSPSFPPAQPARLQSTRALSSTSRPSSGCGHTAILLLHLLACLLATGYQSAHAADLPALTSFASSVSSPLSPAFTATTSERFFTQFVPFTTTEIQFTAVANGAQQAIYGQWNGEQRFEMTSGVATPVLTLNLAAPFNEFTVTLESLGVSDVVYVFDLTRLTVVGRNALLLDLEILPTAAQLSAGINQVVASMSRNFSALQTAYSIQLLPDIGEFTYRPLFDSTSTATAAKFVLSRPIPPGVLGQEEGIVLGNQQEAPFVSVLGISLLRLNITVTAEDQVTRKEYSFDFRSATSAGSEQPGSSSSSSSSSTGSNGSLEGSASTGGQAPTPGDGSSLSAASALESSSVVTTFLALFACAALLHSR